MKMLLMCLKTLGWSTIKITILDSKTRNSNLIRDLSMTIRLQFKNPRVPSRVKSKTTIYKRYSNSRKVVVPLIYFSQ